MPTLFTNSFLGTAVAHGQAVGAPCSFGWCYVNNANAAIRYLQLFDQVKDPATGDIPTLCFEIPGGVTAQSGALFIDKWLFGSFGGEGVEGYPFTHGLAWGISTTKATFTGATASEHMLEGFFK